MKPHYRYIPQGSTELTVEGTNAVVYIHGADKNCAIGYCGNGSKSKFNYRFRNAEAASRYAGEFLEQEAKRQALRAAERAAKAEARKNFKTSLKVGDILQGSWGYEQTNQEFYEVVRVYDSGKMVDVREIAQELTERAGDMCEYVKAVPGKYVGEVIRKPVREGDYIPFEHFSLTKWDGKEKYQSHYA